MKSPLFDEINPKLWYGVSQASRFLGIDPKTINTKAKLGAMNGGLDFRINQSNMENPGAIDPSAQSAIDP